VIGSLIKDSSQFGIPIKCKRTGFSLAQSIGYSFSQHSTFSEKAKNALTGYCLKINACLTQLKTRNHGWR